MSEHPLQVWWRNKSGWSSQDTPTPECGMSEGRLAIDAWNAAIEHAAMCIVHDGNPLIALQRIQELKYPATPST